MMLPESNLTDISSSTQEDSTLTDLSDMLLSGEEADIMFFESVEN